MRKMEKSYCFSVTTNNMMAAVRFCKRVGLRFTMQADQKRCYFILEVSKRNHQLDAVMEFLDGINECYNF